MLAFHPMHKVVFTKPEQFGVLLDRLVNRSVVLLNPGSEKITVGTALASKETEPHGDAPVPLMPLQLPGQLVATADMTLSFPVPPITSPELVPAGLCAPPWLSKANTGRLLPDVAFGCRAILLYSKIAHGNPVAMFNSPAALSVRMLPLLLKHVLLYTLIVGVMVLAPFPNICVQYL